MINDEWLKSLDTFSIDALRFENEKRQAELFNLDAQLSPMIYHPGQANDDLEQKYEQAGSHGAAVKHFDAGAYQSDKKLSDEKIRIEARIRDLKEELKAIEILIESKSPVN